MSMKYLGETFDLHTGGIDNLFPHHENEIAQAEAATGKEFVRTWMHCAHLKVNGEKMSKSAGNFFTLRDLIEKGWSGREIRYVLVNAHYRQGLNFAFSALEDARKSLERIDRCVDALTERAGSAPSAAAPDWATKCLEAFAAAVNDDLNTPKAFAALFELVREANGALATLTPPQAAVVLEVFRGQKPKPLHILGQIVKNPLVIASALGILTLAAGIRLPHILERTIQNVSAIASPLQLFLLGAFFQFSGLKTYRRELVTVSAAKLIVSPGLFLGLGALLGFRGVAFVSLIGIFASPTAVNSFTMAQQMGGDAELAGDIVVTTSAVSILTMFLWIFLFKSLGMF